MGRPTRRRASRRSGVAGHSARLSAPVVRSCPKESLHRGVRRSRLVMQPRRMHDTSLGCLSSARTMRSAEIQATLRKASEPALAPGRGTGAPRRLAEGIDAW